MHKHTHKHKPASKVVFITGALQSECRSPLSVLTENSYPVAGLRSTMKIDGNVGKVNLYPNDFSLSSRYRSVYVLDVVNLFSFLWIKQNNENKNLSLD